MPAFLTIDSATDVRAWSGLNLNIHNAIENAGIHLNPVAENLVAKHTLLPRIISKSLKLFNQTYHLERNRSIARQWSRHADQIISNGLNVKTVISTGSIAIAQLPRRYKTAIWSDSTFHSLRTTYPGYEKLSPSTIASGDYLERVAYERASLVCFSSEWAANDAAEFYQVPRSKIAVIPFGANCDPVFATESEAASWVATKSYTECHILFIGVDWERKGGPLVLEAVRELYNNGTPVILSVVGCSVPPEQNPPECVRQYGFLNKHESVDLAILKKLFKSAHILCVPSIAECFGLVYAEASAYAVPSIGRDVGGVSSAIHHSKNGLLLPRQTDGMALARLIQCIWDDRPRYMSLALNSYQQWAVRLNWTVAGEDFVRNLRSAIDPVDLK